MTEVRIQDYYFWLNVTASCASCPIGLQDSLIINISGKNQVVFLHGVCHQAKVASETSTFGSVLSVVPLVQSDCRILILA